MVCAVPPTGAPILKLTLVGTGEPLLRVEKCLSCAAAALGLVLELEIRQDAGAQGIPFVQTPRRCCWMGEWRSPACLAPAQLRPGPRRIHRPLINSLALLALVAWLTISAIERLLAPQPA